MTLHDLVMLPYAGEHLVLSHYAISSRSNRPKSRKWPKTSFLALWIIQKCIFLIFEWSSMSHIMAKLLRPFSIVKICNIKLIRWTKLKKMANNWMDHSKRPTRRTKKNLKRQPEFFRTCGFRGVLKKRLLYHKIGLSENSLPRFSVKIRSKLKKGCFWHCIAIIEWSRIFPDKPPCAFLTLIVLNLHAKKLRNPVRGSSEKVVTTNYQRTITGLTSTDVENCNVL